jgi:Ca2+-dependent lipid-binding protein
MLPLNGYVAPTMSESHPEILYIHIVKAIDLVIPPNRSKRNKLPDPYCIINAFGTDQKLGSTNAVDKTVNPVWDTELTLHLSSSQVYICVQIFDEHSNHTDTSLGQVVVPLCLISSSAFAGWIPISRTLDEQEVSGALYLELEFRGEPRREKRHAVKVSKFWFLPLHAFYCLQIVTTN